MNYVNINPGIKSGMKQPYTIMMLGRVFFLTHDESNGMISWNMFMDNPDLKQKVEESLQNYLTNR